eukprot:CAMPEP_0116156508 /NCGR_PEP_ID=MMETSP0329-20121206/22869_1 /TAXON_ID=697910 /ORGANISM="Pseudo-nitzschia arenysensis, Strain B593" /LENGTH=467 /DNA_ID=CAMNT_0003653595 /DNA_START=73 /DNA_END=1476 /DNA_ORIENTATION=+
MTKSTTITFALVFRALVALAALGIWSADTWAEAAEIQKNLLRGSGEPPQKQTRIINGNTVYDDRYPYFSLMYGRGMCGGVLISPTLVLTAAHCDGAASILRIGAYESPRDAEYIEIRSTLIHPDYTRSRFDMDIMIYQLKKKSTHPYIRLNPDKIKNGDFYVVGFGDTDAGSALTLSSTLQEVELKYVDNDTCDDGHGGNGEILDDMMCVEGKDADSCIGDSGGPLILKGDSPEEDSLVGIVSWGRECAMKGVPGVYARISYFYDWIIDTVCDEFPEDSPPYMGCRYTHSPTKNPTEQPSKRPTRPPTNYPTVSPTIYTETNATNATKVNSTLVDSIVVLPTEFNVTEVNATDVNATDVNATDVNATEGNLTVSTHSEEPVSGPTLKPTRLPTTAPIPNPPNALEVASFVSWEFVSLSECEGHCTLDAQCKGDLVCFKRSLSGDIPGCAPGKIGLNVDVCVDPFFLP